MRILPVARKKLFGLATVVDSVRDVNIHGAFDKKNEAESRYERPMTLRSAIYQESYTFTSRLSYKQFNYRIKKAEMSY